ncbi:beta-glucosidase [Anaerosporobacter sp.]
MEQRELEEKIELLLQELTLQEKIKMIHGAGLFQTGEVERLHIPSIKMSDGPMGVRNEFRQSEWIPSGTSDDYVTYCPSNSALATTWNKELAQMTGQVLGEEARGRGKDVILAPGINIKRTPLCGRNFEYFSEDPYLISKLVVPLIEGIESADVAACVKHFALNNQETERLWVNVEIDERALREIYLPGFEAAVKEAQTKSLMGAYNLFRGEHCCQSEALLGRILREEWNYDGLIESDWGGVHDTKKAAESPLDIEMSVTPDFDEYCMANPLLKAVNNNEIKESFIDEKIRNILRFMLRLKMIDVACTMLPDGEKQVRAVSNTERKSGNYNTPSHRQAVLETARESIVLLKNEEERLPLDQSKLKRLLVIGENAVRLHALGGGSAEIKALYEVSPLLGLKCQLGGNCEITYAQGYYVPTKKESEKNWQEDSLEDKLDDQKKDFLDESEKNEQKRLREEAVKLAAEYDDVIYIGGLNHEYDVEGFDRDSLELPYEQDELIQELLKVNPKMIVVMMAGNPVGMNDWLNQAKAVLWLGYCGMEGGNALTEVLLGKVNPSGKLAESMPFRLEDTSVSVFGEYPGRALTKEESKLMNAHLTEEYLEGIFVGYRYYEKYNVPVQFCFGHGLSYTEFSYSNIQIEWKLQESGDEVLIVRAKIRNIGKRAGKEIVQLYVGEKEVSKQNPVKELKGFEKILLQPDECKEVEMIIKKQDFSHYDESSQEWIVKDGKYVISVGSSLMDIRLQEEIEF